MTSMDFHNRKKGYETKKRIINELCDSENKILLQEYMLWHDNQLQKENISYGSALRSLEIALDVCDNIQNIKLMKTKPIQDWWINQKGRKRYLRTGSDRVITQDKNISIATQQKLLGQLIKFLKFIELRQNNIPLELFKSKSLPKPNAVKYLFIDEQKKRKDKPRVNQKEVKKIIEHLNDGSFIGRLASVLVSLLNDCGLRYSEAIGIRVQDIKLQDNYLIIDIKESKTSERSVPCFLAKNRLLSWLNDLKNKSPIDFVFVNSDGGIPVYSNLRKHFKKTLKELDVDWPENSSFHFFRHLTSSRFSEVPYEIKSYWFGWAMPGMTKTYSHLSVNQIVPYYLKILNEECNPMQDESLNFIDVEEKKNLTNKLDLMVSLAVEKYLKQEKHN